MVVSNDVIEHLEQIYDEIVVQYAEIETKNDENNVMIETHPIETVVIHHVNEKLDILFVVVYHQIQLQTMQHEFFKHVYHQTETTVIYEIPIIHILTIL